MSSAISYEFYNSKLGVANGVATLNGSGKVPESQLPAGFENNFKSQPDGDPFTDEAELIASYPTGKPGDYAIVASTKSQWYWNDALTVPAWVNEEITEDDYNNLSSDEKKAVPYNIIP